MLFVNNDNVIENIKYGNTRRFELQQKGVRSQIGEVGTKKKKMKML